MRSIYLDTLDVIAFGMIAMIGVLVVVIGLTRDIIVIIPMGLVITGGTLAMAHLAHDANRQASRR